MPDDDQDQQPASFSLSSSNSGLRASSVAPSPGLPPSPISPPSRAAAPMQDANQFISGRGLPMSEINRNWNQQNLRMTPEVLKATQPYFQLVQNLGREFKEGHTTKIDPVEFAEKNRGASDQDLEAREAQVARNAEFVPQAKALRENFKNVDMSVASAETKQQFEQQYAAIREGAGRTQESELERLIPPDSPLRTKLDPMTGALRDPSTGLYADMKKMGEGAEAKNVLILGGTMVGKMNTQQLAADLAQGVGIIPGNYKQADQLAATLKAELDKEGTKLETAGHSLGGGLANYAGLKNGVPATCFNAAALGPGTRNDIPAENLQNAKNLAVHVNVKNELISDIASIGGKSLRSGIEDKAYSIKNAAKEQIDGVANSDGAKIIKGTASLAGSAVSAIQDSDAGKAVGKGVKSVRDMLGSGVSALKNSSPAQFISNTASDAKNAVIEKAKDVRSAIGNSTVGQKAGQAADFIGDKLSGAANYLKETKLGECLSSNVGMPKGLGLPHQYGQSYEMDVPEAKNAGAKHNTKAIEKGFKAHEEKFQQQELKQEKSVSVGSGGGGARVR